MPDVPVHSTFRNVAYLHPDAALERLLASVSPGIVTNDKAWTHRRRFVAPSLLGMFAAMLLEDLDEGRTMRTCVECSTLFVSGAHSPKYCSHPCQWKVTKRGFRSRMARAQRLHSKGKSAQAIAKQLKKDVTTVKGWIAKGVGKKTRRQRTA